MPLFSDRNIEKPIIMNATLIARNYFGICLKRTLSRHYASNPPNGDVGRKEPVIHTAEVVGVGKFRRPDAHYHPIAIEMKRLNKDEEELRRQIRYTTDWREHELEPWTVFRSFPHFSRYFPRTDARAPGATDKSDRTKSTDLYFSQSYLPRWSANAATPSPSNGRKFVPAYEKFWLRSMDVRPTDVAHVLSQIAYWYSVGVKPLNLVSEALNLLPTDPSRKAVVLCMYYKAGCMDRGLPRDEDALECVENFLGDEGATLGMMDVLTICDGFFFSDRQFRRPAVANVVAKRFFQLLQSGNYLWDDFYHLIFKQLNKTAYQEPEEMRQLTPALEASGFFVFCSRRKFNGLHDVYYLLEYLVSKSHRDEALLRRCHGVLKDFVQNPEFKETRSKDISRPLLHFAQLSFKPDDDVLDRCVGFYRSISFPEMKETFGISLLKFLDAASLFDIFTPDIIDAFFSSDLVQVVRGRLPGMKGESKIKDPWRALLQFDEILGILHPDYSGTRLPERTKSAAKKQSPLRKPSKNVRKFVASLNDAFCDKVGKKGRFVDAEHVLSSKPEPEVVVKLGKNDGPLPNSSGQPRRKIAVQALGRHHYLMDSKDSREWILNPALDRHFRCLTRLGYEVVVVDFRQMENLDGGALAAKIVDDILK